jgi:thiamine biosynthesis lipoprotein
VAVTEPSALAGALRCVIDEVDAIDRAASRFRADSELAGVHAADGRPVRVSPLLAEAVQVALDAAAATGGLVDPTVGSALVALGYDRDFGLLGGDAPASPPERAPGWRTIRLDRQRGTLQLAPGTVLDLGASGKAFAADRAAGRAAAAAGCGVLVSLGGDVAVAGPPPPDGWPVGIAEVHSAGADDVAQVVAISAGGLATSSTTARTWQRDGRPVHHIVDPATGQAAAVVWRTVSVAAASCVDANIASTAALLLGAAAPGWLEGRFLPARLVAADGAVMITPGWPAC